MEIFRGLRDVEKHILKFLPNRDIVRLQRVCKTWQNMLHSIEIDRIRRLPVGCRGIWRNMITERYDDNCVLFLFDLTYVISKQNVYLRTYICMGSLDLHIANIGSSEMLQIEFGSSFLKELKYFPEIKNKTRWIKLFPEDK